MTEIGESVRIFGKILQRGNLGLIAVVYTYFQCVIWTDWEKKRGQNFEFLTKLGCQIKHKPHAIIPLG